MAAKLEITVGRGGRYGTYQVDESKLKEEMRVFLLEYGARQWLGDGAAGKEGAEAVEAVKARHDAILAGKVPTGGGGSDPLRQHVMTVISKNRKKLPKIDRKTFKGKKSGDIIAAFEKARKGTGPKIRAAAEALMAAAEKAATL